MRTTVCFILFLFILNSCSETSAVNYRVDSTQRILAGAVLHLGNGETIENAIVTLKNGFFSDIEKGRNSKADFTNALVDRLDEEYHIYPFIETAEGNSGIVIARPNGDPLRIEIITNKLESLVKVGAKANLIVCKGAIDDEKNFKVAFVVYGDERVDIMKQSDYSNF